MLLLDWIAFALPVSNVSSEKDPVEWERASAWADIADGGREGTQLHSLPVFTQLAGDKVRKGRVDCTLPSAEINSKIAHIFNRGGNFLQFSTKGPISRYALPSHLAGQYLVTGYFRRFFKRD